MSMIKKIIGRREELFRKKRERGLEDWQDLSSTTSEKSIQRQSLISLQKEKLKEIVKRKKQAQSVTRLPGNTSSTDR